MGGKPRSSPFVGIKRDVLTIASAIPSGRVATFGDIAAYLTVMARHVAYILATLSRDELDVIPWHRVVGVDGQVRDRPVDPAGLRQRDRLGAEGVAIDGDAIIGLDERRVVIAAIAGDVRPGKNYGGR